MSVGRQPRPPFSVGNRSRGSLTFVVVRNATVLMGLRWRGSVQDDVTDARERVTYPTIGCRRGGAPLQNRKGGRWQLEIAGSRAHDVRRATREPAGRGAALTAHER